ncbi:hypothetical protein H4R34_000489 [Dimargaris verticillata]|uniref:RGS domain-containing protein n=1 Tax=Dimargaris verticillata TaxID=2761393 RepID=A0A9W8B6L9_9FUNG|nr:hypothetical protein H4R34_000489 [Dimargaris verticillata]
MAPAPNPNTVLDKPVAELVQDHLFAVVFYNVLAGVAVIYIVSTTYLFYRLGLNDRENQLRSKGLILMQSGALLGFAVLGATFSGLQNVAYPCFLHWWGLNFLALATSYSLTARALRYLYIVYANQIKTETPWQTMRQQPPLMFGSTTPRPSEVSECLGQDNASAQYCKQYQVDLSKHAMTDLQRRGFLGKWIPKHRRFFASDEPLLKGMLLVGLVLLLYVLLVQVMTDRFSLSPLAIRCRFGWEYYVTFAFIGLHVLVAYPIIAYHLWPLNDPYGLCRDLLVFSLLVTLGSIMFIIWVALPIGLSDHFSSLMWIYLAVIAVHTSTVTQVVYKTLRQRRRTQGMTTEAKEFAVHGLDREFVATVDNPAKLETLKRWASECLCVDLVLFLEEYQSLKSFLHAAFPVDETAAMVANEQSQLVSHNSFDDPFEKQGLVSNCNGNGIFQSALNRPSVSIREVWQLDHPRQMSIKEIITAYPVHSTMSLKLAYLMFYQRFLDPASDLCVGIAPGVQESVRQQMDKGQYPISVFDEAHREVLLALYTDVYSRLKESRSE